ncbi:hypothetical protein [Bacteroides eggerthii]|jgi:hypothetical protein|uniref:hypothetical protein n=1 Tax=Bacteroides eggerthii TaxID=28111 RepID=UPI0011060AB1|nr:hypothetical protein [Bacteroides eggerthii]
MTETKHPENTGNKGFIPLSRNAYKQLYRMYGKHPASETEAYCILIANVNYHDSSMTLYGNPVACPCGDSIKSLDTWARLFRWNRSRVRRFFLSLQKLELIEYSIDHSLAHVHVVDFLPRRSDANDCRDELFDCFWQSYHDITLLPKRSIGRARREWMRLSIEERNLAIEQIPYYYEGLANIRYCKQAASYLADKCFLDEEGGSWG